MKMPNNRYLMSTLHWRAFKSSSVTLHHWSPSQSNPYSHLTVEYGSISQRMVAGTGRQIRLLFPLKFSVFDLGNTWLNVRYDTWVLRHSTCHVMLWWSLQTSANMQKAGTAPGMTPRLMLYFHGDTWPCDALRVWRDRMFTELPGAKRLQFLLLCGLYFWISLYHLWRGQSLLCNLIHRLNRKKLFSASLHYWNL